MPRRWGLVDEGVLKYHALTLCTLAVIVIGATARGLAAGIAPPSRHVAIVALFRRAVAAAPVAFIHLCRSAGLGHAHSISRQCKHEQMGAGGGWPP